MHRLSTSTSVSSPRRPIPRKRELVGASGQNPRINLHLHGSNGQMPIIDDHGIAFLRRRLSTSPQPPGRAGVLVELGFHARRRDLDLVLVWFLLLDKRELCKKKLKKLNTIKREIG
jgi:hypothetical protein